MKIKLNRKIAIIIFKKKMNNISKSKNSKLPKFQIPIVDNNIFPKHIVPKYIDFYFAEIKLIILNECFFFE